MPQRINLNQSYKYHFMPGIWKNLLFDIETRMKLHGSHYRGREIKPVHGVGSLAFMHDFPVENPSRVLIRCQLFL